jgi:hypothetical protein
MGRREEAMSQSQKNCQGKKELFAPMRATWQRRTRFFAFPLCAERRLFHLGQEKPQTFA